MRKIIAVMMAIAFVFTAFGMTRNVYAEEIVGVTPSGIVYTQIGSSIDAFITEREAGLASCVVSVFDRNGVIYNGYYGYSDMENQTRADAQTVYEWASCSKLLVWVAVMQQWESGNIDLDADIRTYLPDGFLTKLQYPDEKITMLNLMSHNAGFQDSFYENQEAGLDEVYDTLVDALRACECYQAYHVGEYTAYSNWGTALAAYIVERTSGMDYVTYVHQNIFAPLGMTHTSLDPKQCDNAWVAAKRHELRCYLVTTESTKNYGEYREGVQLYPAGSAIGTLEDLSAFAQALVAADCPLFEKVDTRDVMFSATSYYSDTNIAKNCHGLWTGEYLVQTLGHAGNSGGCSSNLVIDPQSGLGVVIMTNEPRETAFNYGIPGLLFGHVMDREEYQHTVIPSDADVSGIYLTRRTIDSGAAKAMTYLGGFMPWAKEADGTYAMKLFGFTMDDSTRLVPVGGHAYVMQANGMEMFMYIDGGRQEMMSCDYIKSSGTGTVACFGFILFGRGCIVTVLVKLMALIVRKCRRSSKKYSMADWQILAQQIIYGISGVIFTLFTVDMPGSTPVFVTISAILAKLLAYGSFVNGGVLCYNTVTGKLKMSTRIKQYLWAALCVAYAVFIIVMQLDCSWKL